MADPQYSFDTERNSYFNGRDLRVTETGTGHRIIVNVKDGMLAVEVKDRSIARDYPADVLAAAEQLGDERTQQIYEEVQGEFWQWADDAAKRYQFETVYQAGRSGGWLAVAGTEGFDAATLIEPAEGEEGDADLRERFLAFAFEVERSIEDEWRPLFHQQVKAVAAEPVYKCPNCSQQIDPAEPGHETGCVFGALLTVIEDRGDTELANFAVEDFDVDGLWNDLGRIVDGIETELRDEHVRVERREKAA